MKIIILDALPDALLVTLLAQDVVYRPDILLKSASLVASSLRDAGADAVVTASDLLEGGAAAPWRAGTSAVLVRVEVGGGDARDRPASADPDATGTMTARGADLASAYTAAFHMLEALAASAPTALGHRGGRAAAQDGGRTVTLVGAGVVNLITGYVLQEEGYEVEFVDGGPDHAGGAPWSEHGCSRGGDDARMFTLSEMDNYNDKVLSTRMNGVFNRRLSESGWSIRKSDDPLRGERAWTAAYENVPVWLAGLYNADVFAFNRASQALWRDWIEREGDVFAGCQYRRDVLRLYSDVGQFDAAVERQARIGALKRVLTPDEVASYEPALSAAARGACIAGGMVVAGFTVNVHKFMRGLVERMGRRGAAFSWGRRAQRIVFDGNGAVAGLAFADGLLERRNLVLSPGAYAGALLDGTGCQDRIHGVLGAWLRLPNVEPRLEHSLKLARKGHVAEDANVTVATDDGGRPIMIIGSGYGHTGSDPRNVDQASLVEIYEGIKDTAKRYFPDAYAAAWRAGTIDGSLRYCVRPWTANGLGLFETIPTVSGGRLVITGGHNTGGFAQSPVIAEAVHAALEGREHPMHRRYHPDRTDRFTGPLRTSPPGIALQPRGGGSAMPPPLPAAAIALDPRPSRGSPRVHA